MKSEIRNFLIRISLISLALVAAGYIVLHWFLPEYYKPVFWLTIIFFFMFTLAVHTWQVKMAKKDFRKFTRTNMAMTLLRLLVYSVFTVICLVIDSENAIPFVVVVMILYIVYTATEITSLLKYIRSLQKNN